MTELGAALDPELDAAALQRLRAAVRGAAHGLVGREALVELVLLAAVAGEHLLVVGPPGTGKSEALRRVGAAFGGRCFEYLLGRFTEPAELFGPVDLRRLREGALLLGFSILTFAAWTALKPEMFYHFDPRSPLTERPPLAPEIAEARLGYALRLLRSGGLLALLDPAALLAGLPMGLALAVSPKEWEPLVGPSAHYTAFWMPFLLASSIAGAGRMGRWGGPALLLLNALSFPWVGLREGPRALRALGDLARAEDRVAADYDTIHLFGQREVLWNVAQLELPEAERPRGWAHPWPISLDAVDLVVDRADDPLVLRAEAAGWVVVATVDDHVALRRR